MSEEPDAANSALGWLERKIATLDALFQRFGREGLKDQAIADVGLLLSSKEMRLRDAPKGRDLSESQKSANRLLELEIKDLTSYVRGQVVGLSLSDLRAYRHADNGQQSMDQRFSKPKERDRSLER